MFYARRLWNSLFSEEKIITMLVENHGVTREKAEEILKKVKEELGERPFKFGEE
jgi:fructosamine-3-kinase